jgi:ubiquinone/menaquinone biosynthesis C-methylase UbiE
MSNKSFLNLLESRSRSIAEFYPKVHDWQPFFREFSNGIPEFSTLLDFGCGEGDYLIRLVNEHGTSYGVGVDTQGDSVKKAIQNAANQNLKSRVDFIKGSVEHMPFKKEVFGGVIAKDIFHHLPSFLSILELSEITKPGGKLLVVDQPMTHPLKFFIRKLVQFVNILYYTYGESFQFFSPDMLEHTLRDNNFEILRKQHAEFFYYFLYLLVLLPESLFRFALSILSNNLNVMSSVEKAFGRLPGINKFCAYVYLLAVKTCASPQSKLSSFRTTSLSSKRVD